MRRTEKIQQLQKNYSAIWNKKQTEVLTELSSKYGMFCVCGKLLTGFHEKSCNRFKLKVMNETYNRLKHLTTK